MRFAALLLWFPVLLLQGAGLSDVRSVYILPMASGLDQYVANSLTNMHVFQVVADPKRADAIFTDQLGNNLEQRLEELNPTPPPPAAETDDKDSEDEKEQAKPEEKLPPRMSTFGRGKGTVFLVDAKSRHVLWSAYEKPKDFSSGQLDRTANRIVSRLKKSLSGK